MKYIKGDLVRDAEQFDVIVHQCNCFCNMGAGIAPQIKQKFPEAYTEDLKTLYGDLNKLGTISYTKNTTPIIVNAYGQYKYTRTNIDTNYDALRKCLHQIKQLFSGKKFGLPLIGSGLGGGNWQIISSIIEHELAGEDVTIVVWEKDNKNLYKFNL